MRVVHICAALLERELTRMGLPTPELSQWVRDGGDFPPTFVDVAHPTGTTRISDDPATGVVDAQCRVHGIDGLYVAGSSVFPTAGHCNPTQMIVALAIRLADHLKQSSEAASLVTVSSETPIEPGTIKVLVTGATGRIGHVVVDDLIRRGYLVRGVTSKATPPDFGRGGRLEWQRLDFLEADEADYDELIAGCAAVVHLGAEIGRMDRMKRVNVDATRRLVEAAERAHVRAFCYTSTVSVYGSGLSRTISEESPVLTVDHDVASEYWALEYVRSYGRTKLAGELALRGAAKAVRYVVFRPTVVVDVPEIIGIRDWSLSKRVLAAHRHAHHVYVLDVSDAIIWSLERAFAELGAPGSIETYNLSEDDFAEATHADFMRKALSASGDRRFRVPKLPGLADWAHDFLRFRTSPLRNPLWRMRFPSDRLRAAGYTPRFGMAHAQALALQEISNERGRVGSNRGVEEAKTSVKVTR